MQKSFTLKTILFLSFIIGLNLAFVAQEPYTGSRRFKVGDRVEATYLGDWTKAVVVGGYEDNGFGGTYEIQFEGQNYSAGRINAKWVRPRADSPAEDVPRENPRTPNVPTPDREKPSNNSGGALKKGDGVMYRGGGPIWERGAKIVSYDAGKRSYRIQTNAGGDIVPCHSVAKPNQFDNDFFVGKWAVFVGGAATTFERGGDLYRRFSGGAKLPPLEIKADGTFVWRDDRGRAIRGNWEPREGVPGITILGGLDGKDWTVYESTEGYAPTEKTLDEIRFHDLETNTGYYVAYRIGENKSCVLTGRAF